MVDKIRSNILKQYLKPRKSNAHKGECGHVLIVGGNKGLSGSVKLAALGALRAGAGLVTIATRPEHLYLNKDQPEIMIHGVEDAKEIQTLLIAATVIIIGPGLGQDSWAKDLYEAVLKTKKPLIVDADALNLLAKQKQKRENWILTPHPGEAARLLDMKTSEIQTHREESLRKLQKEYKGIIVLKGADTLVIDEAQSVSMCQAGNPGMASGGMGDLLSGIIAGLLAQGLTLSQAAKVGVYIHAAAGDLAAEKKERGLLSTDLLPYVRQLVNT